jgi:hypothetical protein
MELPYLPKKGSFLHFDLRFRLPAAETVEEEGTELCGGERFAAILAAVQKNSIEDVRILMDCRSLLPESRTILS